MYWLLMGQFRVSVVVPLNREKKLWGQSWLPSGVMFGYPASSLMIWYDNHMEINVVSRHPSVVRNKLGQTFGSPGSMDRHPAGTIFAKGYLLRRYTEEHDPGDEQCSLWKQNHQRHLWCTGPCYSFPAEGLYNDVWVPDGMGIPEAHKALW